MVISNGRLNDGTAVRHEISKIYTLMIKMFCKKLIKQFLLVTLLCLSQNLKLMMVQPRNQFVFCGPPALEAPSPPPPLPNSTVATNNTVLPTVETELSIVEVDNAIPTDLDNRLANLISTIPMKIDLNLRALTYDEPFVLTYDEPLALTYDELPVLTYHKEISALTYFEPDNRD